MINDATDLSNETPDTFSSYIEAKNWFTKKFIYQNKVNHNFFKFFVPAVCKNQLKIVPFSAEPTFNCSLSDVETILGNKAINSNVLDFIFDCLKFYSTSNIRDDEMPKTIFVTTDVVNLIVPSKKTYFKLWEYFNEKHHKDTLDSEELSNYLKHWYSRHNKEMFTKILDKYTSMNLQMANMMFRINLSQGKHALLHVKIPEGANKPQDCTIVGIDYSDSHYQEIKYACVWFSKFIGLYMKEVNLNDFIPTDFDSADIEFCLKVPEDKYDFLEDVSMAYIEMFEPSQTTDKLNDLDLFNLLHCLAVETGRVDPKKFLPKNQEDLSLYLKNIRLVMLKLIANLFEDIHGEDYNKIIDHIQLIDGDKTNMNKVKMFKHIHFLCNNREYQVSLKEGLHANQYMNEYTLKQVIADYNRFKKEEAEELKKKSVKNPLTKKQKDS